VLEQRSPTELQAQARTEETRFQPSSKKNHPSQVHPEENARIVLEAFPVEQRVSEFCCREGIRRAPGGPGGIRTHDSRIKSPSLVRSHSEALTRLGEVALRGRSNAKVSRRHPTLADEGIPS